MCGRAHSIAASTALTYLQSMLASAAFDPALFTDERVQSLAAAFAAVAGQANADLLTALLRAVAQHLKQGQPKPHQITTGASFAAAASAASNDAGTNDDVMAEAAVAVGIEGTTSAAALSSSLVDASVPGQASILLEPVADKAQRKVGKAHTKACFLYTRLCTPGMQTRSSSVAAKFRSLNLGQAV